MITSTYDVRADLEQYQKHLLEEGVPKTAERAFCIDHAYNLRYGILTLRYPIDAGDVISNMIAEKTAEKFDVSFDPYHVTWSAEDSTETHEQAVFMTDVMQPELVRAATGRLIDAAKAYKSSIKNLVEIAMGGI